MKTVSVGLVACLNIGTPPPHMHAVTDAAKLECWIGASRARGGGDRGGAHSALRPDPNALPAKKSLELIGKSLQQQYERWQTRVSGGVRPPRAP